MEETGHLPDDLSLAEFWEQHIRSDPDIVRLFDAASADLYQYGYIVKKATPNWLVYVRYENWSSDLYRWLMGRPFPRDRLGRKLISPRIKEAGEDADELASEKIRNTINHLRSGTWVASGAIDPPTANFERFDINREFWAQPDVVLDFSENKLCQMDGKKIVNWYRAVRIRMQPNTSCEEPGPPSERGAKSRKLEDFRVLDELRVQGKIFPGDPRKESHGKIMRSLGVGSGPSVARGLDLKTVSNHIRDWGKQLDSDA